MKTIILLINLAFSISFLYGQSVSLSSNSTTVGGTITVNWSGFSGNVNVCVYKGSTFWTYANTNASGSGSQNLVTTGWEIRSDYNIRIELKTNINIYVNSTNFSVNNPSVSLSTNIVTQGGTLIVYWAGFTSNVNVCIYKGSSFWQYANTNASGSGSQNLVTTTWESRSDYRVKIELKTNTNISIYSGYFSVTASLPDFIVTSVSGLSSATAGQYVNVVIQARNQGNTPSQSGSYVVLRAILSPDQQINLNDSYYLNYSIPISDFTGGGIVGHTFSFPLPNNISGTYYWGGYIDAATVWNETNENNNALVGNSINVQLPPAATAPILQYPSNGITINDQTPDLTWTAENANYFHVQIDNNSNFSSPERENTNVNSYTWTPNTLNDGTYYWRVRAHGTDGNWSDWSTNWNFTINTLPDFIIMSVSGPTAATAGQNVSITVVARNQGPNPSQIGSFVTLRMILSPDNIINLGDINYMDYNIPIGNFTGGVNVSYTFSYQIPASLSGSNYWGGYIDANQDWDENNENNNALAGNSFTIGSALDLTSPTPNQIITTSTIYFSWSLVSGSTRYELYVDNNPGFGSPEISKQHISDLNNLTINSYTISGNWLPENVYYWKVIAITSTGTITSSTGTFTYSPTKLPEPSWVPLYRAFLPSETDHFYCSSQSHLQTAIDGNYQFEGVEGYVSLHPFVVNTPDTLKCIYRFYVPQATGSAPKTKGHYYTCSNTDRDNRIIQGWAYEGITGYGYNRSKEGLIPLYHTWLNVPTERNDNLYTISEIEKNNSTAIFGYTDQGIICYTSPNGANNQVSYNQNGLDFGMGINPQNGNLTSATSGALNVTEGKITLNYNHFYSSMAVRYFSNVNPIGNGWGHTYNASILTTDSQVIVVWSGEVNYYSLQSLTCQTPGIYDKLLRPNAEEFTITKKDQTVYRFSKILTSSLNNTYLLTSIKDRNNNQVSLQYNNNGRLKWVKSPGNKYITFNYYPESDSYKNGLIHYVKDSLALNRVLEYQYDNDRNLTGFIDEMGRTTSYTYNAADRFDHFLTSITYPDGSTVYNTFDPTSKRLTSQSTISGSPQTNLQMSIPTANQVTVTDELGKSVGMQFNAQGNITALTSANGNASFEFNSSNNPTKPTKITDGMGYITTITYDNMGNPLNIGKPYGAVYQYQWNSTNDLTLFTNPLIKQTQFSYINGNLTSLQTPRGTSYMSYLPNGNLSSFTNPLGKVQSYTYNNMNNLQTISDALGNTTTFSYDLAGRNTSITDGNGNTTNYSFLNNNLLANSTDALGKITQYNYDLFGKLTGVTDAANHTTAMSYNASTGLLSKVTDQVNNESHYQYYDNGLLKSTLNRNGQTINYSYDATNRLKTAIGPSLNNTYTYNNNDLPVQIQDMNGSLNFTYDQLNRIVSYTDYYNKQVQYEYYADNNLKKIIYPDNKTVQYQYYDDNLLHTVTDWLNNVTTYTYSNDGSLSRVDLPNGTYSTYAYDDAGRLTGIQNKKSEGTIISSYVYTLDNIGNHTVAQIQQPLELPGKEPLNNSYTYNNANRIQQAGSIQFTHDLNGNLKSAVSPAESYNYNYNTENKLNSVSGSFNASYVYDAMGNRRAATRNGITTRYVLDISGSLDNVLVECNASNLAQYYYIYGAGLLYRIKASDNSIQCYHYDSRGSTIAITNQAQNITHKYNYDDFGKLLNQNEIDFNPYRYVGKFGVMYEDSLLYFMRARYYRPDVGRFLSEDPEWNKNLYSYASNNPIMYYDPVGRSAEVSSIGRQQELRRELLKYMQESAKYEQRDILYGGYQEFAENIEKICSASLSTIGGPVWGLGYSFVTSSINIGYGLAKKDKSIFGEATTGLIYDYSVDFILGMALETMSSSNGYLNAAHTLLGFGFDSGNHHLWKKGK